MMLCTLGILLPQLLKEAIMEKSRSQIEYIVLKYSLQNAVFYNGKANPAAVLGKVMAKEPGLRKKVGEVKTIIEKTVSKINTMPVSEQKKMLRKIAPSMLVKEEKKQEGLPALPKAKRVVTRFAPSPTGPLNLSQLLRAGMLSYLYAKKYKGKFILRIEDTDPRNIEKDFYDMIKEDLLSVGIKWNKLVIESNNMKDYYKNAEKLLNAGKAYICLCPPETFRKLKDEKKECECRNSGSDENIKKWKKMLKGGYKEGEAVVRLKTDMNQPNPALRDPVLLRIIKAKHPLKGNKYKVWPVYNFANVIEDHESGITHVFRGKEHEHNTKIQERVYTALGWKPPHTINFGMIYLPGKKLHTRDIKQGIKERVYSGWDDPALPTIRALLRRGFQPETFRESAIACSLSKTDIVFNWESFETTNRKVLDPKANRYMVVFEPVKIFLKNYPKTDIVRINLHPDFPKRGKKRIPLKSFVYISKIDFKNFGGKEIRLKGLFNIKLVSNMGVYTGDEIVSDMPKIQWVSEPNITVEVVKPEGKTRGIGEPAMKKLKPGEVIQMERVGFARVDSKNSKRLTVYFAHK